MDYTLQFSALLSSIKILTNQELSEVLKDLTFSCSEIDPQRLIALLESPENQPLLSRTEEIVGIHASPEILQHSLRSAFSEVRLDKDKQDVPPDRVYPQVAWSTDNENIFPVEPDKNDGKGGERLQGFLDCFDELCQQASSFAALYAGTLCLVDEHLWCFPASVKPHFQDVSFAEVVRLKSAVAACLGRQDDLSEPEFTLVVGDLSGIQPYVFGITEGGKGASGTGKRLRARSLFVQLLADVGMQAVLREYDLPPANILMASGGRFYVLWPRLPDNVERLDALRQKIDRWVYDNLRGELRLALAATHVNAEEISQGFGQVFDRIRQALHDAKNSPLAPRLQQDDGWNEACFLRDDVTYSHGVCPSCQRFPVSSDGATFCTHCTQDAKIGEQVARRAKWLALYRQPPHEESFAVLDTYVSVLPEKPDLASDIPAPDLVFQLGGPLDISPEIPALWRPTAPYVGQLDFDHIATSREGREFLGYVKADVDNLGAIFGQGFSWPNEISLDIPVRVSGISRQLDRFFGNWLPQCLSRTSDYRDMYTVFAGGDDLFVIGHWEVSLYFAKNLRQKFHSFVGQHPNITLTAGLAFVKPRHPLGLSAKQAEDLLDLAKNSAALERRQTDGKLAKGRNQVTMLGDVVDWDVYSMLLHEQADLQKDNPPSAFLYDLLRYAEMWYQFKQDGNIEGLRFQPLLSYNITRNVRYQQRTLERWAKRLVKIPPDSKTVEVLNHLGTIATLAILAQ